MTLIKDSYPLVLDRKLACIIGLNEALVLGQIHYWLEKNKECNRNFHEGRYWTYNTIKDWQEEFPFWSESTIKRIFKKLRDMELIIVDNFNTYQMDRTLWYSIDYEKLEKLIYDSIGSEESIQNVQHDLMDKSNKTLPIPENYSEIISVLDNPSIHPKGINKDEEWMDDFNQIYNEIIYNCELYSIDETYREGVAQAIKLLVLDVYNSKGVRIGERIIPSNVVYMDLENLNFFVIEKAIENFKQASSNYKIKNPIAYLKTCIYNAIYEVSIDVDANLRYNNVI